MKKIICYLLTVISCLMLTSCNIIILDKSTKTDTETGELSEVALASLQGNIKFDGLYLYDETGDDYDTANSILTIYGTDAIHQIEADVATGTIYYNNVYINNNGTLAIAYRTIDNEIEIIDSEDKFEDFYNPFNLLKTTDFTLVEDNTYEIKDLELAKKVATTITGWNESLEYFYVTFDENNEAISLDFVTSEIIVDEEISYVSTYEFDILEHGIADVDQSLIKPYEKSDSHLELEEALKKAMDATNYTIQHFDHEEGYEDVEYNVYVTENAIYSDCIGWEKGYVQQDEYVYPFYYNPETEKATLSDPVSSGSDISEIQAIFTGFNVALFEDKGNGVFVLRDNDFAGTIAQYFAEGYDEMKQYYYATDLTITIKDNELYQVSFTYATYGITATVTLTYSNFNNTVLPIEFEDVEYVSVLDDFIGTYRDDKGNFAVIDESGVNLNGKEFTVTSYDEEYAMLVGIYEGETYYINKLSQNQLYISNEDYSISFTLLTTNDFVAIETPKEFRGVWENEEHSLVIQTYMVKLDGVALSVSSYNETEGLVALDGNTTYCFSIVEGQMFVLVVESDSSYYAYSLDKTNKSVGIEIPQSYVGSYESLDGLTKIEITYSSITVNGSELELTMYTSLNGFVGILNGVENYKIVHSPYSKDAIYYGFEGDIYTAHRVQRIKDIYVGTWASTVEGSNYVVVITETSITINGTRIEFVYDEDYGYTGYYKEEQVYLLHTISAIDGTDCIVLYSETITSVLVPSNALAIAEKFIGAYVGVKNDVTYKIEIATDMVYVTIGSGERQEVSSLVIDDFGDLSFSIDGVEYYLIDSSYSDPVMSVMLMTIDYSFTINCNRTE